MGRKRGWPAVFLKEANDCPGAERSPPVCHVSPHCGFYWFSFFKKRNELSALKSQQEMGWGVRSCVWVSWCWPASHHPSDKVGALLGPPVWLPLFYVLCHTPGDGALANYTSGAHLSEFKPAILTLYASFCSCQLFSCFARRQYHS